MGMVHQKETEALMRDVLGDKYVDIKATKLTFEEDFVTERVKVRCEVTDDAGKNMIEGEGVGLIDAFFAGLQKHLAKSYPSLTTIVFADFSVKADVTTKKVMAGSDAAARIELIVENPERKRFSFQHASRSVTHSSVVVTTAACAYFVNSERAFLQVRQALDHARKENRHDTVKRYTAILAQLVENTSYSDAIEKKTT
jgi:LeuA allosteric (dimerisation) domain